MRRILGVGVVLIAVLAALGAFEVSTLRGQGTAWLEGVVKDPTGTPIAGVEVQLAGPGGPSGPRTRTDVAGRFIFPNLAPGTYQVTAHLTGFTDAVTTVTLGDRAKQTLALVMPPVLAKAEAADAPLQSVDVFEMREHQEAGMPAAALVVPPAPGTRDFAFLSSPGFARGVPFNTEGYAKIDDHSWTDPRQKPLSTFSIDVDTASYANIRRFLTGGTVPPKDAVRIEELINYFGYDYPEPTGGKPFSITSALADSPWHQGYQVALIGLQARRIPADNLPPRNLVFLIDVSGSMQAPNKLPLVKASLGMLARNLTARDHVAIVVYAGAAGLVLPPTRGDDPSTIVAALNRLEAGGSTNGAQGLRLAYDTARQGFAARGVNRVIIATDGDFNVGVTSHGDLIRLIEAQRDGGIALSVLGFGMGNLKDELMEQLADKGNGNYSYIDDLAEARKVLVEEAGGTLVTVAKDVKLQVEFNPATVSAYRLIGYENRALDDRDFNDDKKDAGDMGAGHSVTALYEIVPAGQRVEMPSVDPLKYQTQPASRPGNGSSVASGSETMTVKVRYKAPDEDRSNLMTVPVGTRRAMTPELGFSAAVASFGMLLRDSEFKGAATFASARELAERYRGTDRYGHRAEFIRLIALAESMRHGEGTALSGRRPE
jgi:Ca-activated chloride channel homolog